MSKTYKTSVIIVVESEGDVDPHKQVVELFDELLPPQFEFTVSTPQEVKRKIKVLGEFTPDEVLPFICENHGRHTYEVGDKTFSVRMDSHRYHTFQKSMTCAACGIEGFIFLLELPPDSPHPHFNLYAIEHGQKLLMTKDHIRSKAHGGPDHYDNYQTMCATCNRLKGSAHLSLEAIARLRQLHNQGRRGGAKKCVISTLRRAKQKMTLPLESGERKKQTHVGIGLARQKSLVPHLTTLHDLKVCQGYGKLFCWPNNPNKSMDKRLNEEDIVEVFQIPIGVIMQTTGEYRQRNVEVMYLHEGENRRFFVYHGLLDISPD